MSSEGQVTAPDLNTRVNELSTEVDESNLERQLSLSGRSYPLAALLGVMVVLAFSHEQLTTPTSEYAMFYKGGRLAGTPSLYSLFDRLPFYAVFLSPLGKLTYGTSLYVWLALSAGAVLAFILLWPRPRLALLACAWSLPLLLVFMFSEDDTFLLALLALIFRFYKRRPLGTGLLMSFLSIKFNLFLLLPVLLLGQRRWKMAFGFALGCAILVGLSFWTAGYDWPARMSGIVFLKSLLPREYVMPNIRGSLAPFTDSFWPELALDGVVFAVVCYVVRRADFALGMAATIVGSLLVSHHAGPEDCVLLVPVALIYASRTSSTLSIYLCLALLVPAPYVLLSYGPWASQIGRITFVAVLAAIAISQKRRKKSSNLGLDRGDPMAAGASTVF